MTKIKILFILNYRLDVGGISGQVDVLRKKLNPGKFETTLLNTRGNVFQRLLLFFTGFKAIRKSDLLHVHACSNWGGFFPALLGVTLGRLFKKKIVLTYHGGDAEAFLKRYPKFLPRILGKASELVVLSDYFKHIFEVYKLDSQVIPNIRDEENKTKRMRKKLHPHFISTRALEDIYNIPCILDAFKLIHTEFPNARLTLLGSGSQEESLKNYCRQNKISVDFKGKVPNEVVPEYLLKHDILLSSPLVDNMPVSLLEAFDYELLVISSHVGGVPSIIEDGVNGLLFESNNPEELARKIRFALENKEQSLGMIREAKGRLEKFAWKENEALIENLYIKLSLK